MSIETRDGTPFRAQFIVLEGIDGAGTTTQLHRVCAWFEAAGQGARATCEPTEGPIGRLIRQVLRGEITTPHDTIALLFAADRLDHWPREIQPALDAGKVVLSDRYTGSSLAYQGTHTDADWVRMINGHAPLPHHTFYVRCDPDVALARIAARDGDKRELYEQRESLVRIAAAYDRIYGVTEPAQLPATIIDGEASQDAVFAAITAVLTS
ncbi:MAG: dTMP kinase [Myxococcota bacterium]|jgi:dTMP kinase